MLQSVRVLQSVTECYKVLQSVKECYRLLQSVTECYRVLQSITEYKRVLQNITEYYRVFLAHLLGPIFGLVQRGSLLSNNHISVKIIKFYVTSTTLMCFSEDHGVLHNLLHLSCRLLHHVPLRLPCGETGLFRIQN